MWEAIRSLLHCMQEVEEKEVRAMLDLEVIEPSTSDWRSPIVLVPKPDGTCRCCIDFWRVNMISKFVAYPMPQVDKLLDHLWDAPIHHDTQSDQRLLADLS